ncbi:hypothetical protein FSP39_014028 [Pinctada imbricata]|uniref:Uncharacterized protein n=1 Tax=Pinctada imbricata TaxID=66713 RepID=A0AA88YTR8_PINIB|nr:hypothetical protein FSP39_014028 [Pinctada imbricata]
MDSDINNSFVFERKFTAQLPNESKWYLNGIIVHPKTDDIYVLDRGNMKLKMYSPEGEFKIKLDLIDVPHSMCYVPETEEEEGMLIITKPDKCVLEYVTTSGGKLEIRKYIMTKAKYFGICNLGNEMIAVSSWSQLCIDILSLDGSVIKTIDKSRIGSPLFKIPDEVPEFLSFIPEVGLVISEAKGKVVCLKDGEFDSIKWHTTVPGPVGDITFDKEDNSMIVCLLKSSCVLFLDRDGNEKSKLQLIENGVERFPIAARRSSSRVFITDKSGEVLVYKLK